MAFDIGFYFPVLALLMRIATALGVVGAVYFAFRLYRETDKGWYWAALVLSAFFMALSQWIFIIVPFLQGPQPRIEQREIFGYISIIKDSSEILASLLFAIACYGIYTTMHHIRKRVE